MCLECGGGRPEIAAVAAISGGGRMLQGDIACMAHEMVERRQANTAEAVRTVYCGSGGSLIVLEMDLKE